MLGVWKWKVKILLVLLSTLLLTSVVGADKQLPQNQPLYVTNHNHHQHNNHHQHHHQHQHQHEHHKQGNANHKPPMDQFFAEAAMRPIKRMNVTTRLRRLNTEDYYHKVLQRRLHQHQPRRAQQSNEWDYHAYNVQNMNPNNNNNNNHNGPAAFNSRAGKGDDNTQDVEFISVTGATTPKRPAYTYNSRRFAGSISTTSTTAPPALVPAQRGYSNPISSTQSPIKSLNDVSSSTPITEGPLETNTQAIRSQPPYQPEEMERRHICVQQRVITMPVKTTEIYTRPIWKHVSTPCQSPTHNNQMCTRVQLVHKHAYRDVIRHKSAQSVTYDCCTGWTRETPQSESCSKPYCSTRCQNGGTCTGPDSCSCPSGYSGRHCEMDINECQEQKPCDQTCINTMGSYQCRCRDGFVLQADQQSCKKISTRDEDAFEARDLENEVDMGGEDVSARLHKIERSLENERVQTHELKRSLQSTYNVVDTLKSRLSTLEKQQMDVNRLQTNLYATETRTNKLEGILNLLIKCRNGPNANCP